MRELGTRLEELVDEILRASGYTTERNKILRGASGARHEIDILARRSRTVLIVECKNYAESRKVGKGDVEKFVQKLSDLGVNNGLFVTNTSFTKDAVRVAEANRVELWDGETLKDRYFRKKLGRLERGLQRKVVRDVIPLRTSFHDAVRLDLINAELVEVQDCELIFHPYYVLEYHLRCVRKDPTKKKHVVEDRGVAFLDGMSGDVVRKKLLRSGEVENILELLSKEKPVDKQEITATEFSVYYPKPEINLRTATSLLKDYVVEKNIKTVNYVTKKGELKRFEIVPDRSEVTIKRSYVAYVPLWEVTFNALGMLYMRRMLGNGTVLQDDIAYCQEHLMLKRRARAVCSVCGAALCERHALLASDQNYYCKKHAPEEELREERKGVTGLFKRLFQR